MIDHKEREAAEAAWDEGFESGMDFATHQHTPSGQSIDPPANPYRGAIEPKTVKPEHVATDDRVWYESRTPNGKLWCETHDLEELREQNHPALLQLTYYRHVVRVEQYRLPAEPFNPFAEVGQ